MNQCQATTKAGTACQMPARHGRDWCARHDPELADERIVWLSKGGKNNSNQARAQKAMPDDLKTTLATLYRTLAGLEDGSIAPNVANAIASVSKAIVAVWTTADVERRLGEIEALLSERDAAA